MSNENLLGVPETRLPDEPEVRDEIATAAGDVDLLRAATAAHPASSLAWATLADVVYDPDRPLESYAYARVGYHRGLDALRKAGWRGQGPIPWEHEPNRGVLRALYALKRAAQALGEDDEASRLDEFLRDADADALDDIAAASAVHAPAHAPAPRTETIVIRSVD